MNISPAVRSYAAVAALVERAKAEGFMPAEVDALGRYLSDKVAAKYAAVAEKHRAVQPEGFVRHDLEYLAVMVERATGIDRGRFRGRSRRPEYVVARKAFVWAAVTATTATTLEIAAYLGRPGNHSTVIYLRDTSTETERAIGAACGNHLKAALAALREIGGKRADAPGGQEAARTGDSTGESPEALALSISQTGQTRPPRLSRRSA